MAKHRAKWWTPLRVMRTYLLAFMLVLAVTSYLGFTKPIATERPEAQERMFSEVPEATPGPPPMATGVAEGQPLAYMEIPRFGDDWFWVVSEGTAMDILNRGPGHFTGTALPGAKGNTAYAAHRATHGDPFIDFDKLQVGDTITLSQSGGKWTYTVTLKPRIIEPSESWVIKNMKHGNWLTLTTCWPKYGSSKRMYVRAELTEVGR